MKNSFNKFRSLFAFARSALLLIGLTLFGAQTSVLPQKSRTKTKRPKVFKRDVLYYPTPDETVDAMLEAADIKAGDVLIDLGSGDGRIPIRAAKDYNIRAIGIEIDPELNEKARRAAEAANVADKTEFKTENFFSTDLRRATIVTLFLSESLNLSLKSKMLRELPAGARIVSHDFPMGDWKADKTVKVPWIPNYYRTVYVWNVPKRANRKTINKKPSTKTLRSRAKRLRAPD